MVVDAGGPPLLLLPSKYTSYFLHNYLHLTREIALRPLAQWRIIGDIMASNPPLIFVHGIKGCELIGSNGVKKWLRIRDMLYNKDTGMSLPISWNGGIQSNNGAQSGKPISSLAGKSIYGKFLNGLKKKSWKIHSFTYDWRRSQEEAADLLVTFIENITNEQGTPLIITHSNGGIVTELALRKEASPEIHGVLHCGVPFGDGVSFLPDMTGGERILRNRTIIDQGVHFTWTAPWTYFPLTGHSRLYDKNGAELEHNWYDSNSWMTNGLGLFSSETTLSEQHMRHLDQALLTAQRIRQIIESKWPVSKEIPPTGILRSSKHQTPCSYKQSDSDKWCIDEPKVEPGDGRILFDSAKPLYDVDVEFETSLNHGSLLNDSDLIERALIELFNLSIKRNGLPST